MSCATAEWVVVTSNIAVIASDSGEFWFLDLEGYGDTLPFSSPMTGNGSRGSTGALLGGAVALGLGRAPDAAGEPTACLARYALDLVGSYHNSRRTVGNYLKAAERFRCLNRPDLAAYLERHAREENGHERLALRDLCALSLPADRIVANLVPEGVGPLCELFDSLSSSSYPVGCIGYSYFFESAAAKRQKADIDALQALCPAGVDATRFMRAHSSLGSEIDHVRDMIGFIASLPTPDRIEIAKAAYVTAVTASNGSAHRGPQSESAMWAQLQEAAGDALRLCA